MTSRPEDGKQGSVPAAPCWPGEKVDSIGLGNQGGPMVEAVSQARFDRHARGASP
jgi:hypothetical protein